MTNKPKIFARVDPAFQERLSQLAALRFEGNESMVVRAALELYMDLRDVHGARFDIVVEELRSRTLREGQAA